MDKLKVEFLRYVLTTGSDFSYDTVEMAPIAGSEGQVAAGGMSANPGVPVRRHFQVLQVATKTARPKVVPVVGGSLLGAALNLYIQEYDQLEDHGLAELPDGSTVVFPESEPAWMSWRDLAEFHCLRYGLVKWGCRAGTTSRAGCAVLSEPGDAVPALALEDEACPSLLVIHALRDQGWTMHNGLVQHCHPHDGAQRFDVRNAIAKRLYLRVCLQLSRSFIYCQLIPSDQCGTFYRCLLKGIHTEAGHKHVYYAALLAGKTPLAAIEDEGREAIVDDVRFLAASSDDDQAPPVINGGRGKGKGRGRGGKGRGRGQAVSSPSSSIPALLPPQAASSSSSADPAPLPLPLPSHAASSSGIVVADENEEAMADAAVVHPVSVSLAKKAKKARRWVPFLGMGEVAYDADYAAPGGHTYSTWFFKCGRHANCMKRRLASVRNCEQGRIEPLAYLHAWYDQEVGPAGHVRAKVPSGEVDRKLADVALRSQYEEIASDLC